MRWVVRGVALVALAIGWGFIAWQNHFRISAPVVFVGLGYLAVISTIYNLWRTGASAVTAEEEGDDSTWAGPVGELGELEREKRTLLKAIKEAEFDREMGKLSQRDAEEMIASYRARAIEVIKHIDRHALGAAGTPREQIQREVRARLALDAKAPARDGKRKAKAEPADASAVAKEPAADASAPADAAPPEATDATAASASGAPAAAIAEAPEAPETPDGDDDAPAASTASAVSDDVRHDARDDADALDADSTTAVEPRREVSAKAATP